MSTTVTRLFLIRHGATASNEKVPYILQGSGINGPLSETGQRQAAAASQFLSSANLDAIYSSPLIRAQQTAEAIAEPHQLQNRSLDGIQEVNVGQWEGKSWEVIKEEHPEEHDQFHRQPGRTPYLGGESYQDVLDRTKPVLEELLQQHQGETIAVVAHNVVNRAFLAHVMGIDIDRAKSIRQINTCVNVIRSQNGSLELDTLNSYFHLPEELVL